LTVMGAFSDLRNCLLGILGKDRDRPVHALISGQLNDKVAPTYLYPRNCHWDFWASADSHRD
jgi:hypothetical protein